jgi:hypothetical protein
MLANAKLQDVVLTWAKNKDGSFMMHRGNNNVKMAEWIMGVDISKIKVDKLRMMCPCLLETQKI